MRARPASDAAQPDLRLLTLYCLGNSMQETSFCVPRAAVRQGWVAPCMLLAARCVERLPNRQYCMHWCRRSNVPRASCTTEPHLHAHANLRCPYEPARHPMPISRQAVVSHAQPNLPHVESHAAPHCRSHAVLHATSSQTALSPRVRACVSSWPLVRQMVKAACHCRALLLRNGTCPDLQSGYTPVCSTQYKLDSVVQ